jgi:hypothetical protein
MTSSDTCPVLTSPRKPALTINLSFGTGSFSETSASRHVAKKTAGSTLTGFFELFCAPFAVGVVISVADWLSSLSIDVFFRFYSKQRVIPQYFVRRARIDDSASLAVESRPEE